MNVRFLKTVRHEKSDGNWLSVKLNSIGFKSGSIRLACMFHNVLNEPILEDVTFDISGLVWTANLPVHHRAHR